MYNVIVNSLNFNIQPNKSIFISAKEQDILIEHSCLSGRCSSCKARVLSGTSETTSFELGLSEEERNNNYILTCVRNPTSDLILDLNVISGVKLEKPKTIPVKIHEILKINSDIIKIVLRFPPKTDFKFLPGQYVNIIKGNIKRSYSIGGVENDNMLIFYIKVYPNGLMSKYLIEEAKENDLLRMEGPFGTFFLREQRLQNIIFLATGTGIAPILSILQSPINKDLIYMQKIFVFHGGRLETDLIELEYFKSLDINYFPTLSRCKVDGFYEGYVQYVLWEQEIDLTNATVYACGSSKMIEDSKKLLISKGLQSDQFYSDAFLESN